MKVEEIRTLVERKYKKGESLFDGGFTRVENIHEEENFIVYSVVYKNCNKGGTRNSGITVWEGIFASDGIEEIEIKPLSLWRDGENTDKDRVWLRFSIVKLSGTQLILRNFHDLSIEICELDFKKARASLVKKMTAYDWEMQMAETKKDFYYLIRRSAYDVLRSSNPLGSNKVEAFVMRDDEAREIGDTTYWQLSIDEIKNDETIILIGTECLYGDPVRYRVFRGKLREKAVQIMMSEEPLRAVTRIKIFTDERKVRHERYTGHDKGKCESIFSTINEIGF